MEVCVPHNSSHQDRSHNNCSSLDPHNLSRCNASNLNMNEMKTFLCESYQSQGTQVSTSGFCPSPKWNGTCNIRNREDGLENSIDNILNSSTSEKSFSEKAKSLPRSGPRRSVKGLSIGTERQESGSDAEFGIQHLTPTVLKLVSAMKGSREKQGIIAPRKLSVTWASDVYDPSPTSVSHVLSDQNQQYGSSSRRNGKNKQKSSSKSAQGSKGKDKKQARKKNGNVNKIKPL